MARARRDGDAAPRRGARTAAIAAADEIAERLKVRFKERGWITGEG